MIDIQKILTPTPLDKAVDPTVPPAPLSKTEELLSILITKMDLLLEDQRKLLIPRPLKGDTVTVFSNQTTNALSDFPVDCRGYNAVHVAVIVNGDTPSTALTVLGASEAGALYIALPDTAAAQAGITANMSFETPVGSDWVRVQMSATTGTYAAGQGYIVWVTPYIR